MSRKTPEITGVKAGKTSDGKDSVSFSFDNGFQEEWINTRKGPKHPDGAGDSWSSHGKHTR